MDTDNKTTPSIGAATNEIDAPSAEISRISVKVPPFWAEHPEIWFAQIESQFVVHGVRSDQTRFNTIIGNMESKILSQVSDAVLNPPLSEKYANLKKAIIDRFSESSQRKMQKMLSGIDLGDKKPSFLYNELKQLGGITVSEEVLKTVWLQQMPPQVKAILATSGGDLKHLASVADAIFDTGAFSCINEISSKTAAVPASSSSSSYSDLQFQIAELTRRINNMQNSHRNSRSPSRSRSSSSRRSNTPSRSNSHHRSYRTCWYHRRFGTNATKCINPCDFEPSSKN